MLHAVLTGLAAGALLYIACGIATMLCAGPRVRGFVDIAARHNIQKYGRLPSFQAEVIYFALAILLWPVAFGRMCR